MPFSTNYSVPWTAKGHTSCRNGVWRDLAPASYLW
jgi:hypothetical protein